METTTATMMEKRPVAQTLRSMAIGDVEYFPLIQFTSVRNAPYFSMRTEKALGWRFKYEPEDEQLRVKVTRLK